MRYNEVTLYGVVSRKPNIIVDKTTGKPSRGYLLIEIVRGDRYSGDKSINYKHNTPVIRTDNPDLIQRFEQASINDTVYIKGVVVTSRINKNTYCDECGTEVQKDGTITYIAPIFFEVVRHHEDRKTAIADLDEHKEISNSVKLLGTICSDIEIPDLAIKTPVVQYKLAVARSYRINEEKTDFIMVKSFGDRAREDEKRLRTSSRVLVDGYLRNREIVRHTTCPCCGNEYTWDDRSMEIVPYSTEYINNFLTGEEEELAMADI